MNGSAGGVTRGGLGATPPRIAAFVSGHGFGHAARSSAVLQALHQETGAHVELFSDAPPWFFQESIGGFVRHHRQVVDVGFRQLSALHVDLPATVEALDAFLPLDEGSVARLADIVTITGCQAVLCDISSLGIAVAERAGVPSVLVENFTWGWLYEPLTDEAPELAAHGAALDGWVDRAGVHLQARPVCRRRPGLESVDPISRAPRVPRSDTRARLGVGVDDILTVVTMGGYGEAMPFLDRLTARAGERFIVTGADETGQHDNLLLFDNATPLFMPDLLHAADAVVAKLGYGTVSEVWRAGIPFAWVVRENFREMEALDAFASAELSGFGMRAADFGAGDWVDRLEELRALPRIPKGPGGGGRVADVIADVAGF